MRRDPPRPRVNHTHPPNPWKDIRASRPPRLGLSPTPLLARSLGLSAIRGGPDGPSSTKRAAASLDLRLKPEPSGRTDHNPTQRSLGSRSRLRSRGNQRSLRDRDRSMAGPDEAEAQDKGRVRWDRSVCRRSPGPAAIMRCRLRPRLDLPGQVPRQAI